MDVKEYLLSLMAIVTGLAIADMIVSPHGLLRRFRKVHWDWLPVVAAFFCVRIDRQQLVDVLDQQL